MTEAERKIETSKSSGELLLNSGREIANLKQQSYDQCEIISHLDQQLKEKDLDILKLQNDLADALEVKQGQGPTALSMLYNELKSAQQLIKEKDELIQKINNLVCFVNDDKEKVDYIKSLINKAQ